MQVAVTGANGQVGRRLLTRLRERGVGCTALVRAPVTLDADRVVPDWLQAAAATAAIAEADCIVHLAGTLAPRDGDYEAANLVPTRRVAAVLGERPAAGVVFLSYVGATASERNAYLRTKGQCEQLLQSACEPATVFRCTHIIGSPEDPGHTAVALRAGRSRTVNVLGSGRQRVAPVFIGDVVEAIVRAVQRSQRGTFDLPGPRTWTMDDLVRILNPEQAPRIRHVPPWLAKLSARFTPGLSGALVEVMCRDSAGDPAAVAGAFDLALTDPASLWGHGD